VKHYTHKWFRTKDRLRKKTAERKRLQGIFRAKLKDDQERYFNNLADEIEEGLRHNDLRPAFEAVRRMKGSSAAHVLNHPNATSYPY